VPKRLLALFAAAAIAATAAPATGRQYQLGALVIRHPWAPPTTPTIPVAAAYLSITNQGKGPDALIGVSSPAAEKVWIHHTITVDNMARMRPLAEVEVPPGATVNIEPGGIHFMLMGLKAPLQVGQSVPLVLEFRTAGRITVELSVEPR
jgi:copper(I)-binding protein